VKRVLETLLNRVTVIHSLPGRVRLHLTALTLLPEDAPVDDYTSVTVAALPGITSVRVSRVTGTALIEYQEPVTEAQVVDLVHSATGQILAHAERFAAMTPEERKRLEERVRRYLSNGLLRHGTRIVIPHEIWHE
jgi:hypothetical protein